MTRTRRAMLLGAGAAAITAASTFALKPRWLFGKRYPQTPYDDLLSLLADRGSASQLGKVYMQTYPSTDLSSEAVALRRQIAGRDLQAVMAGEAARGQLVEVSHWLIPQTLAGLCALAANN